MIGYGLANQREALLNGTSRRLSRNTLTARNIIFLNYGPDSKRIVNSSLATSTVMMENNAVKTYLLRHFFPVIVEHKVVKVSLLRYIFPWLSSKYIVKSSHDIFFPVLIKQKLYESSWTWYDNYITILVYSDWLITVWE